MSMGRLSLFVGCAVSISPAVLVSFRQAVPPRLTAKIELTIGSASDVSVEYSFTDIRGLALGRDGRVLVADYGENTIRVYSSSGNFVYSIGRQGAGPGDLSRPCCIAIDSVGRLWVKELGNRRYSVFTLADTVARFARVYRSRSNPSGYLDRVSWDSRGRVIHVASAAQPSMFVRTALDSTGRVLTIDTVPPPPSDSIPSRTIESCTPRGCGSSTFAQPLGPVALRAFGPKGDIALAVSSNYAVSWIDATGKRIALLRRDIVGPEPSAKERQRAEQVISAIVANHHLSSAPFGIPQRKAPLVALGFDLDGRLWVQRSVADGKSNEADVYERSGRWAAVVEWPANVRMNLWTVSSRTGLGVAVDADGVQSVVRLHLR